MKLNRIGLQDRSAWEAKGVQLPQYDVQAVAERTLRSPKWIHFGAGNIFRGFIARLQQELLNAGADDTGIIACDTFDFGIIDRIYDPFDNLTMMVTLMPDGRLEKEIVASVARGVRASGRFAEDMALLRASFRNPSLQLISFTITEKGYALKDIRGAFLPVVQADFENGPENCAHAMSIVTSLLLERYNAGGTPLAVVSMDNCSHNGEKLRASVMTVVEKWLERGFVTGDFAAWVRDESMVSFPWSMIDKITPRPAPVVEAELDRLGIEDMRPIVTERNTFIAPFVNAEKPQYLVIEDRFPNGRPALEKAGVYFTTRDTVNDTERMKVTTCLNPLHTALAVYGCLLGYTKIADEMADADLRALVEGIGAVEGMPVVTDPGIIEPRAFLKEVVEERLPNPFMPDTPQRIATDTSQKVAIRFGETIKSYIASDTLDVRSLTFIPLAIAGWLRYLLAVDDRGEKMECSPDPMLATLQEALAGVELGKPESVRGRLDAILKNVHLFGVDLVQAGLSEKIERMTASMLAGPGAVRKTLGEYL